MIPHIQHISPTKPRHLFEVVEKALVNTNTYSLTPARRSHRFNVRPIYDSRAWLDQPGLASATYDYQRPGQGRDETQNMLTETGFWNLVRLVVRVMKFGFIHFAPPCGLMVFISVAIHRRSPTNPWGDVARKCVTPCAAITAFSKPRTPDSFTSSVVLCSKVLMLKSSIPQKFRELFSVSNIGEKGKHSEHECPLAVPFSNVS